MMFAVGKLRAYIQGSACAFTTVVITDNNAVCSLVVPGKHFTNRRLATYAAELGDLDVAIAHRSGRVHFTPDWMSRFILGTDADILEGLHSRLADKVAELDTDK